MKLLPTLLSCILFNIGLAILPLLLTYIGHEDLIIPHFWLVFAFLSALTFLVVITILIGQQINPEAGAQFFLGATVFKILACLFFALIFILKNRLNKYIFVADFFYIYFLNMAFEIHTLLRNLRNQKLR
ncbi:hypothetical protein [Mucilaginibacter sp. UR6-11]|uniref:hypothetical protein n=1 Tax=Mucilaginibacter sp. UR6-11 TaxID=1435644 RepID=UPI001E4C8B23|nr:hypothetical protein [Mucilaginibacter sp. UR6-11]MCC8425127.1 hypothetical protein [Mucilaginibacter sp. UR6-11]